MYSIVRCRMIYLGMEGGGGGGGGDIMRLRVGDDMRCTKHRHSQGGRMHGFVRSRDVASYTLMLPNLISLRFWLNNMKTKGLPPAQPQSYHDDYDPHQ